MPIAQLQSSWRFNVARSRELCQYVSCFLWYNCPWSWCPSSWEALPMQPLRVRRQLLHYQKHLQLPVQASLRLERKRNGIQSHIQPHLEPLTTCCHYSFFITQILINFAQCWAGYDIRIFVCIVIIVEVELCEWWYRVLEVYEKGKAMENLKAWLDSSGVPSRNWAFCGFSLSTSHAGHHKAKRNVWHSWVSAGSKNIGETSVHTAVWIYKVIKWFLYCFEMYKMFFCSATHSFWAEGGVGENVCAWSLHDFLRAFTAASDRCAGCSGGHWSFGNLDAFVRSAWFLSWTTAVYCKQCSPACCLFRFLRARI